MAAKVSDFGYSFATAKGPDGKSLYLEIEPHASNRQLTPRAYWLTRDEVKALIACLDILD